MSYEFILPTINQKRGSDYEKGVENDLVKELYKQKFLDKFYALGLDIDVISNGKKNKNEQFHKFNLFIKDMFENHRYFMHDMIEFMQEDMLETKQVLLCLNEENMYELRYELQVKYHIKHKESKIDLIMEEEDEQTKDPD